MHASQTFAEILESKLRISQPTPPSKPQHTGIPVGPTSEPWTQLIGHISPLRTGQTAINERLSTKAYEAFRPKPKVRTQHQMNGMQATAYALFRSEGALLEENFSKRDLLKAFRQLALRAHPDHGGSASRMQALISARKTLLTLF